MLYILIVQSFSSWTFKIIMTIRQIWFNFDALKQCFPNGWQDEECCGMIGVGRLGTIACVITGSRRLSECRGQGTGMENSTGMEIETCALLCFFCLYSVSINGGLGLASVSINII